MKTTQIMITPNLAKEYLTENTGNRQINKGNLEFLLNEMRSGRWRVTHQGIAISRSGRLLDGQHRLAAIVESGTSQSMLVTTGLEDDDFGAIDFGKTRTIADVTGLRPFDASMCRAAVQMIDRRIRKASPQAVLSIWNAIKDVEASFPTTRKGKFFGATVGKLAAIASSMWSPEKASKIIASFDRMSNVKTQQFTPIEHAAYRAVIINNKRTTTGLADKNIFAYCVYVFDPDNSEVTRVTPRSDYEDKCIAQLKAVLASRGVDISRLK